MELQRQWCDQPACPDFGKMAAGNIKVHSYVEQRYYCTTCLHTFSAERGTFFETLRSGRSRVLDTLALLGERNSLRAIERLQHRRPNTALHRLDLAGQHVAAVRAALIHPGQLTQAQVDELWTFVKKNKPTGDPTIQPTSATCGFGGLSPCPVGCAWSAI